MNFTFNTNLLFEFFQDNYVTKQFLDKFFKQDVPFDLFAKLMDLIPVYNEHYNDINPYRVIHTDFTNNFLGLFPEIFLFTSLLILLVYGLIFSTNKTYKNPLILNEIIWLSIFSLILTLILVIYNPFTNFTIFNNSLIIDTLSNMSKVILLGSICISLAISIPYLKVNNINSYEYAILILISTLGTMLLVSAYDLLSLYLALETQTLAFYILTTFKKSNGYSTEAGLKYFILGAISSGILLFGASFIYGMTGTINFSDLHYLIEYYQFTSVNFSSVFSNINPIEQAQIAYNSSIEIKGLLLGIIFLLCGLLFKLTAVPFHMWAPDVYEGAPTSMTAFFAIVPKLAIFVVFLRLILFSFIHIFVYIEFLLIVCSALSMLFGALGALQQKSLKRLFVYSSISHVGYMLIGITSGSLLGLQGLFLYLFIYMVTNINIWTILLSLKFKTKKGHIKYITELTGLGNTNPILALSLTIALFSMAGIPPLAGFYPKLLMFMSAFKSDVPFLAFVAVISSLIGAFYYLRLIKIMYFDKPKHVIPFEQINVFNSSVISITFLFLILFFIYPTPILYVTHEMATSVLMNLL